MLVFLVTQICYGMFVVEDKRSIQDPNYSKNLNYIVSNNLTPFLRKVIQEYQIIDGVNLKESRVEEDWNELSLWTNFQYYSGDWDFQFYGSQEKELLRITNPLRRKSKKWIRLFRYTFEKFTFLWEYEEGKGIWITGYFDENMNLIFEEITNEEIIRLGYDRANQSLEVTVFADAQPAPQL